MSLLCLISQDPKEKGIALVHLILAVAKGRETFVRARMCVCVCV